MVKILKKIQIFILIISICVIFVACVPNGLNAKSTEITKKFYTQYFKNLEKNDLEKINKTKKTYMTDVLIEEMDLRSKELEVDAITGFDYKKEIADKMVIEEGEDESWVKVTFDMFEEEGKPYNIYVMDIHFRDTDKKRYIDTMDLTIYDVDEDGDRTRMEYKTKYANKEELSDEDIAAMERIKNYYDDLNDVGNDLDEIDDESGE